MYEELILLIDHFKDIFMNLIMFIANPDNHCFWELSNHIWKVKYPWSFIDNPLHKM